MRQIKACGVLVVRGEPVESFLLLKHPHRWDLPKGHIDEGETDLDCALRELREETGIAAGQIALDPQFRFVTEYEVNSQRFGERCHKTVVIFLGRLLSGGEVVVSEHPEFAWIPWAPPHQIQAQTIDPLLAQLAAYLASQPG